MRQLVGVAAQKVQRSGAFGDEGHLHGIAFGDHAKVQRPQIFGRKRQGDAIGRGIGGLGAQDRDHRRGGSEGCGGRWL